MKKSIVHEIIQLKERRKILQAELGLLHEDVHIFSREEQHEITLHKNQENTHLILEAINERLKDDEALLQHMWAVELSESRSENWNRELEGQMQNTTASKRIYEREHIFN